MKNNIKILRISQLASLGIALAVNTVSIITYDILGVIDPKTNSILRILFFTLLLYCTIGVKVVGRLYEKFTPKDVLKRKIKEANAIEKKKEKDKDTDLS